MRLLRALAGESVLLLALVSAVAVALDVPEAWQNVLLAAVPLALAVLVRQVATSPATVAQVVTDAAVQTAERLTDQTAGQLGEVTDTATGVVTDVVDDVVGAVGGLVRPLAPVRDALRRVTPLSSGRAADGRPGGSGE